MTSIIQSDRPMFPHTIDSTILAAMRSCPQKMYRTYLQHWKPKTESVHLIAGGAFAKGIEVARKAYFEGEYPIYGETPNPVEGLLPIRKQVGIDQREPGDAANSEAAGLEALIMAYGDFDCPPESPKSLERVAGALEFYFANYPLGNDGMTPVRMANGKYGIEFSFAEPLPINHPVTGDPILYTGRSDMIANFAGGQYIVDEKTTSQLGASWSRQWEMRSQFTGYQWAGQQHGLNPVGSIIRGVSILKTKYDTQQAITYRSPMEIDRWLTQVVRDVERLIRMWEDNWYDFSLDNACGEYGGCSLLQVCKSNDPDTWLETYFEQKVWDPLAHKKISVEEWHKSWGHNPEGLPTNNPPE